MKCLIVNIMPHGPAYHFAPHVCPDVFWGRPDGARVGFWAREWPDLLGEAVLKCSDAYEWEVWQPDLRADQVYSRTLSTGVTHRLFPAVEKNYRVGVRPQKGLYSEAMYSRLGEISDTPFILHLHGFRVPFYCDILTRLGGEKKFPIFMIGHGMSRAPVSELLEWHRPLTYACLMVEQWRWRKALRHVDVISEQAESALQEIKRVYAGRIPKLTMGCDFNFWTPLPTVAMKNEMRKKLNVSEGKKVFFASGNFIPRKQLEQLISAFARLSRRDDFFLLIAGHGAPSDSARLESLMKPLVEQGQAFLHPYVDGAELRDLYWASDVYVSASRDEGSSVGIMKAMACGLPVLSTPVGETFERMRRYGAGKFIPVGRDDEWHVAIEEILDGRMPLSLDRAIAEEAYSWPQVARRFLSVYEDLYKQYFSSQVGSHV